MTLPEIGELPEPQIVARELSDRRAAHQFHVTLEFGSDQAEGALDTGPAGCSQGIKIVAANADSFGANRKRLQHVTPALDAAIHKDVDPIAYGIDDLDQLVE
jgi:hypothetical protein